jgi:hypothetical protein
MNMSGIAELYNSGDLDRIVKDFDHELAITDDRGPNRWKPIITFGPHRDDNFTGEDIRYILGTLSTADKLAEEGNLGGVGSIMRGWCSSTVNRFVILFLSEIRQIICTDKKAGRIAKTSKVSAGSVVSGLTAWITSKFGVTDPIALGVATAVLLSIVYATKGAFCKMTDDEVKKEVNKRVPRTG